MCLSFFDPFFLSFLSFCISLPCFFFSPTCQVRVSRFYQSCLPPSSSFLLLPLPSSSFLLLPPPSSSRSQWTLQDLNCELLQISVGTARPQLQAPLHLCHARCFGLCFVLVWFFGFGIQLASHPQDMSAYVCIHFLESCHRVWWPKS